MEQHLRLTLLLSLLLAPLGVRCGAPTMWLQPLVDIDPLAVRRCAGGDAAPLTRTQALQRQLQRGLLLRARHHAA